MSTTKEMGLPVLEVKVGTPPGHVQIRITQTLTEILEVTIVSDECYQCGKETPLPDVRGMRFLLACAEDNRLVWPKEEDVRRERGQYPVSGWKRLDNQLICPECYEEFRAFVSAKVQSGRPAQK